MSISKRASRLSPSPTLGITAKAKRMKEEGIDVVGLGAGEPDFDTPIFIKEAAKQAIDNGFTKYTPTSGIKELKAAICEKLKRDNNLDYRPEEIIVSCGAKHAIFNAILTLCQEGEEVILASPYWVSYLEMVKFSGAEPIILDTSATTSFKVNAEQLRSAIGPRTKLFIFNSPSNPTGMVYTPEELECLAEVILEKGIYCLSDEIYEKLIYDTQYVSIASLNKELKQKILVVNGVSKSYAMTGWRIGYCAGPAEIIQAMANIQDHSTSNPTSIAQWAALEALRGDQSFLIEMVEEFRRRRDYMVEKLNSLKGVSCLKPAGAFYCWVNISELLNKSIDTKRITNSIELSEALLDLSRVAVVPGVVFGDDRYIRLSYATSLERIKEGLRRIEELVQKLI